MSSDPSPAHPPPPLASWRGDEPSTSSPSSPTTDATSSGGDPSRPSTSIQSPHSPRLGRTSRGGGVQNLVDMEDSEGGASVDAPVGDASEGGPGPVDLGMAVDEDDDEEEDDEEDLEDYREDILDIQGAGGDASSDGASSHGDDGDAGSGDDLGADDDDEDEVVEQEEEEDPEDTGEFNKAKEGETLIGCKHYRRRCALVCFTCSKPYTCRFCHDEVEFKHELDRKAVQEIKCLECQRIQPVAKNCVGCQVEFASYFCATCRLYDDQDKQQYHCEGCKICRIGGRENFFHCQTCDMCLANTMRDNHKCIEKMSRSNCPVCLEDLHTSRKSCRVPKCGHMLHFKCMQQLLKTGNYACPTCSVSMVDMSSVWERLDYEVELTPMPVEYRDLKVTVLCRDCHRDSKSTFHILGQKCTHCGSYNTCRTADPESSSAKSSRASAAAAEERDFQQAEAEDAAAAAVRELGLAGNMEHQQGDDDDDGEGEGTAGGDETEESHYARIRGLIHSLTSGSTNASNNRSGRSSGEGTSSSSSGIASGASGEDGASGGGGGDVAGPSGSRTGGAASAALAPLYRDMEDDELD